MVIKLFQLFHISRINLLGSKRLKAVALATSLRRVPLCIPDTDHFIPLDQGKPVCPALCQQAWQLANVRADFALHWLGIIRDDQVLAYTAVSYGGHTIAFVVC